MLTVVSCISAQTSDIVSSYQGSPATVQWQVTEPTTAGPIVITNPIGDPIIEFVYGHGRSLRPHPFDIISHANGILGIYTNEVQLADAGIYLPEDKDTVIGNITLLVYGTFHHGALQ